VASSASAFRCSRPGGSEILADPAEFRQANCAGRTAGVQRDSRWRGSGAAACTAAEIIDTTGRMFRGPDLDATGGANLRGRRAALMSLGSFIKKKSLAIGYSNCAGHEL